MKNIGTKSINVTDTAGRRARGVYGSNTPRTIPNTPPFATKISNTPRRSQGVFEILVANGGVFGKVRGDI